MNRYGQVVLDFNRRHRPRAFAEVADPESFFSRAGETIEADVVRLRDEILGPQRPDEGPEEYRLRSYQALRTAEELVLADHWLMVPEQDADQNQDRTRDSDPELAGYYRDLAEIDQTLSEAHRLLTTDDT
jgi:hypothetical protein